MMTEEQLIREAQRSSMIEHFFYKSGISARELNGNQWDAIKNIIKYYESETAELKNEVERLREIEEATKIPFQKK